MKLVESQGALHFREYLLLAVFCGIVFGISTVSGRPLSIHEAVLPQSAREMYHDGDLIVPKKGGTPWLESPPLPQWVTVGIATVFGRCDELWVVRIGPAVMATAVVLMVAWMSSFWFGRTAGLLSGLIMATTCQFTRYAWLAEDEMFLCALITAAIALFVRVEFSDVPEDLPSPRRPILAFFSTRSVWVMAFFVVLGLTNLAKGLLFGTAMTVIPIAGYLLWNRDVGRILRFIWLWGWLAFAAVMLAWPMAAYARYPDVLELWNYDLAGRVDGSYVDLSEPFWYYAVNLPWMLAPWTLVLPAGLWMTRHTALLQRYSPQRFLWCWATLVPLAFSFTSGKHHHYMLHALAPWAILASFGLLWIRQWFATWPSLLKHPLLSLVTVALPLCLGLWLVRDKIPGPDLIPWAALCLIPIVAMVLTWGVHHPNGKLAAGTLFSTLALAYGFGHWYAGQYADRHRFDARFLQQVREVTDSNDVLLVDMDIEPLRGFFCLYYLDRNAMPLHNISFVVDDRIPRQNAYLITKFHKRAELADIADTGVVLQSERTGHDPSGNERLTLFRLDYKPHAPRVSAREVEVTPMQAIYRTAGPTLFRR